MNVSNIRIQNFRGIEDWTLSFKPGFNLIKGENGKGKTAILDALTVGLGGFIAGIDGINTRHFRKGEIRKVCSLTGEGSYSVEYKLPVQVTITANMSDNETYTWTRSRAGISNFQSTTWPRDIAKTAEKMANQSETVLPVLCYQSASRMWAQKRETVENAYDKKYFAL